MINLRLAWREIRNHPRYSLLFILNLTLGLAGFLTLDAFKQAFSHKLEQDSRLLLSADLEISARRDLTEAERAMVEEELPPGTKGSRLLSLYSMASGNGSSRLVQIRAVDKAYPLYGAITLASPAPPLAGSRQSWVYPELLRQLNLEPGGSFRLGEATFSATAVVEEDPQSLMAAASLAPRLYIALDQLAETRLVREGSTVTYSYFYRLPEGTPADRVREAIFSRLTDPGIRVNTHRQASEQMGRLLNYLSDYLGLVALAAMLLATVGIAFLFRTYLAGRVRDMAILMSLGRSPGSVKSLFGLQVLMLALLAVLPVVALSAYLLLPGLAMVTRRLLPVPLEFAIPPSSYAIAVLMAVLGSVLSCFPLLGYVDRQRPLFLLREGENVARQSGIRAVLPWLPLGVVFWALSVWQAHSLKVGSLFWLAFAGSGLVILTLGSLALRPLARSHSESLARRLAFRHLSRRPFASLSCFLALSLGTLLVNVVFQIEASLRAEIEQPESSRLPALFLFDIQEEQVTPLQELVQREGSALRHLSPLVRARLTSVNGEAFDKGEGRGGLTREEERERGFRNRGINLSYRPTLSDSESLVTGRLFSGEYRGNGDEPAEISVEHRFADRLNLKLGDVLEFDVQGIAVSGRIVNLRKVRWTSFQPNFFIQFQPGVLEPAPKTYIAALPQLPRERKQELQDRIVTTFSNISMVDVGRVVTRIGEVVEQMLWAVQLMAYLSLFVGFVVLFSIAHHQANERKWDLNLMKILGGEFRALRGTFWWEFGLLGFAAAMVGALFSVGISFALSRTLFDGMWAINTAVPLLSLPLLTLLSLGISEFAAYRILQERPRLFLASR